MSPIWQHVQKKTPKSNRVISIPEFLRDELKAYTSKLYALHKHDRIFPCTPLAIADRLGHEKVETTLNTYSHLFPKTRDIIAEKLQKSFSDAY